MKRLIFLIALLISVFQINNVIADPNDPVYFADANLKAAVEAALGKINPNQNDMLGLTSLTADGASISNLTGLEYATNLTYLRMFNNQINDISSLFGLTKLGFLALSDNYINDISALTGMIKLTQLYLSGNQISNIVPLSGMTNLEALALNDNQISDISPLTGLTNLTTLLLFSNQINDISAVAGLTNLNSLSLGWNQISDISAVVGLTNLTFLYLSVNQISNISAVRGLTNLTTLYLGGNQINDISAVVGLTNLIEISLYENQISDISAVAGLTNLTSLELYGNQISDISAVAGLTNLKRLFLYSNQISNISYLSGLTNLTELRLQYNQISDISSLAGLTNLIYLHLLSNPLNIQAYNIHIPQIQQNNPSLIRGDNLFYDDLVVQTLTISSTGNGSVIMPGEGQFNVSQGMVITIEAVPADSSTEFAGWTGTAVDNGKVDDPNSAKTTVLVDSDYTLTAVFAERQDGPSPGFSLGEVDVDDPDEMDYRVTTNNTEETTFIERVTGLEPDPNGMLRMQVNDDEPAIMKGSFGETDVQKVFVRFQYLFESPESVDIIVYLSDVPELMDDNDPERSDHYIEIGRIIAPPQGSPGSFGSERFGIFEAWVSTGSLDFSNGLWVELELEASQSQGYSQLALNNNFRLFTSVVPGGSVLIDNLAVEVHCSGICMDLTGDCQPDEEDFMMVISSCGCSTGMLEGGFGSRMCLDSIFDTDGYVDSYDIAAWDWMLNDIEHSSRLNMCSVPVVPMTSDTSLMSLTYSWLENTGEPVSPVNLANYVSNLIIVGKRDTSDDYSALKSKDRFYLFDSNEQYIGWSEPTSDRCNIRLVKDTEGNLYQINSDSGIVKLDGSGKVIVPPGQTTVASEPRYNKHAEIYISIQDDAVSPFGRPVLDAAFDTDDANYVYVVPVVVNPDGEEAYLAAAKLQLFDTGEPPYQVVQLYDDSPALNDNRYRNNLREIEIDNEGNIYVINVNSINESDILWKYSSDGTLLSRLELGKSDSNNVPDPIAMYVSNVNDMVYIASGQYVQDSYSTTVHGFSKTDMTLKRTVTVNNMQHITGITENPVTGELWIAGFNLDNNIPAYPSPYETSFYYPVLANIPLGSDNAEVTILQGNYDLALPMSIVWTGDNK